MSDLLRLKTWLLVVALAALATPSRALDPPPGNSVANALEQAARAAELATMLRVPLGLPSSLGARLDPCTAVSESPTCEKLDLEPCRSALIDLVTDLREARDRGPEMEAAAAGQVLTQTVDAVLRLGAAGDAIEAGRCPRVTPAGSYPAQVLLHDRQQTVIVKPLAPLRAGRTYALVASGLDPAEVERLGETVEPHFGPRGLVAACDSDRLHSPAGRVACAEERDSFAKVARETFAGNVGGVDAAAVSALLIDLERKAAAMPGLGSYVGLQLSLDRRLRTEELTDLRFAFVPIGETLPGSRITSFRTLDARASLRDYRRRLRSLPCDMDASTEEDRREVLGASATAVDTVVSGEIPSLAIHSATDPMGTPAQAAQPSEVPYLLALPTGFSDATTMVIALNGHHGTARRLFSQHAQALAERGLAMLAIDLPEQGRRGGPDRDLLHVLRPDVLAGHLRQAAVDVLAVVRAAEQCGVPLPGGGRYRPRNVELFAYSLGAIVGAIARSVEPGIGSTVLLAPGGDLVGWLVLRLAPSLGAAPVSCVGGPQSGESCFGTGRCAPPGVCIVDPHFERLYQLVDPLYEQVSAPGDSLSYATERTGDAGKSPLLLLTAGDDSALHPALATHLADAYGMWPTAPGRRRGPHSTLVQWPSLGHDLVDHPDVREQVYAFLASNGRRLPTAEAAVVDDDTEPSDLSRWYEIFAPYRR